MTIEVITSLSDLDNVSAEDKATKIFMYPDVANKQFTYYQWDDNAGDSGDFVKLSDSVNGYITEGHEYIRAITDSNENLLFGIESSGNVKFGSMPTQISDYVGQYFEQIDNPEYAYIIADAEDNILFTIKK